VIAVENADESICREPLFTLEEDLVIGRAAAGEEPVFLNAQGIEIDKD